MTRVENLPQDPLQMLKLLTEHDLGLTNTLNAQYWPKMQYINMTIVEYLPRDHAQMIKNYSLGMIWG